MDHELGADGIVGTRNTVSTAQETLGTMHPRKVKALVNHSPW